MRQSGLITYGDQSCEVEILNGSYKGEKAWATNMLMGSLENDKFFEVDDIALVLTSKKDDNSLKTVTMVDIYRINYEIILILGFMLLLILIAGTIGLRAILSFIFTILCIWKVLIPSLLSGRNPILYGFFITFLTTFVIIILVYGMDKRFLAAIFGSLLGTGITTILAIIFVDLLKINGAVMSYSESLLYSGYADLNLTAIFIVSIFIASSGALTDIAVDITSSVNEVVEVFPEITTIQAIKSGMTVGRDALGTMTTTLLLAYSGGYIGLLMVFVAQGTPIINILNLKVVAAEILNIIIGSFGLITVAPFTAITSGILLTNSKHKQLRHAIEKENEIK